MHRLYILLVTFLLLYLEPTAADDSVKSAGNWNFLYGPVGGWFCRWLCFWGRSPQIYFRFCSASSNRAYANILSGMMKEKQSVCSTPVCFSSAPIVSIDKMHGLSFHLSSPSWTLYPHPFSFLFAVQGDWVLMCGIVSKTDSRRLRGPAWDMVHRYTVSLIELSKGT